MITILKSTDTGLEQLDELTTNCWINVVDPTSEEISLLTDELGIPTDFVTYPLDMDERSRSEREDDGTMLILIRIPYFQGAIQDIPYTTIPLGIILTNKYIITVARKQTDLMQEFVSGRVRNLSTGKRNRFVLKVLLATANKFLLYLREINRMVDMVEDRLQKSIKNNEVFELLKYQKSLVYFTTALRSNELMLERLQRAQLFRMFPDDEDLLEDVITENQQAIEMVNISNGILSSMMDAFASIISNNLNDVMKFLASITIVMSIPTIITSFYGMNVGLPFGAHEMAYVIILGLIAITSIAVIIIFWRKDWF